MIDIGTMEKIEHVPVTQGARGIVKPNLRYALSIAAADIATLKST